MKKQRLFKLAVLLVLCCALFGCKPEGESGSGKIYGTITDFATTEPVNGANVQLRPSGKTALTGSDGRYEFIDVPNNTYSIKVTKEGYSDLIDDYDIVVTDGQEVQRDVQIQKLPSSVHIYDNEQHEISELDFGADEGVTQKTFNIFNGGSQSLNYIITKTADWISNISQPNGSIGVGITYPIVITINRELLADGNNTTTLLVTSSTEGGKELAVKARKSSAGDGVYELTSASLMVQTEDLGCVDWNSANLLCSNSTVAGYNDWRLPTVEELMTIYSNREQIGGFVDGTYWSSSYTGGYHYHIDFTNGTSAWNSSNSSHFYVRAVRTIVNVSQNETIELPAANLMVQTQDLGSEVFWTTANLMCESSDLGGYTDWRLPTINELMTLYNNKELIGGFQNEYYWSSTLEGGHYKGIRFSNGSLLSPSTASVRAVRTLNGSSSTIPTVTTSVPTNVSTNTATCGGNITSDGGTTITQKGVCYSSSPNPTTSSQTMISNASTNSFTCNLTGLSSNTTYYVRAYAINNVGTAYGGQESFKTTGGGSVPSAPTGVSAEVSGNRIKVSWNSVSNADEYSVYWSSNGGNYTVIGATSNLYYFDDSPSDENYYKVKAKNSYGESSYSSLAYCHFSSGGGGQTYTFNFESSWENWTTIDTDGDGEAWKRLYNPNNNIGHNNSVYTMGSESFINDYGALTPDNYLVSPQKYDITDGAKISFYVSALDANYPAEHYGIAISTASNSSANSFVMIWEETLSAKIQSGGKNRGNSSQGNWYLKTIDLSAYSGMSVWIALRHFNCTDQFVICVDDITIVTGD